MRALVLALLLTIACASPSTDAPFVVEAGVYRAHITNAPTDATRGARCVVRLARKGASLPLFDLPPAGRAAVQDEWGTVDVPDGTWRAEASGCGDWRLRLLPA